MPGMNPPPAVKLSFRAQMLQAREEAILRGVGRLLAEKGFEAMTVDQIAAEAGIAKASLYKHFASKEALACAAVVRLLDQAQAVLSGLPAEAAPLAKLQAAARWAMGRQLAGEMPALPGPQSGLGAALRASAECSAGLAALRSLLEAWIVEAQAQGALDPQLPAPAVLYTLCARACDPALAWLRDGGRHSDEQVVALALTACFEGLRAR